MLPTRRGLMMWMGHARKRQGRLEEALAWHRRAAGAAEPQKWALPRGRRRVVFVVQHGPSWSSTESVYAAFAADPAWETTVVGMPYIHPFYTPAESERDAIFEFLAKQRIPHVRWDAFRLEPNFADILFLQNPYDITRPEGWRVPDLLKLVPRLAYVPYALEIGGGEENATLQMNLPLQRVAWMVFARSSQHKAMFARHCAGGNAHVVVTGHPKMDAVLGQLPAPDPGLTAFAAGRKLVVWNPQFDVRLNGTAFGSGYSTFLRWRDFLPDEFARRPDMALVIRPHPLFFAALDDRGIWNRAQKDAFLRRCTTTGNIQIDRRPSYLPVFGASAAMISDASSFILEYGATGKPLLYLHNPHGPGLNADGEYIHRYCSTAVEEEDIVGFLDEVAAGRDQRGDARRAAYGQFMHLPAEGVGVAIKRAVEISLPAAEPADALSA